jgi:hypothetical protein
MLDKTSFFRERFSALPDRAERIMARWGIVYRSVDSVQERIVAEHGADIMRLPVAPAAAVTPEAQRPRIDTAQQMGGKVFDLNAHRERRAEAEIIGQERLAQQARLNAEEAHRESAA